MKERAGLRTPPPPPPSWVVGMIRSSSGDLRGAVRWKSVYLPGGGLAGLAMHGLGARACACACAWC